MTEGTKVSSLVELIQTVEDDFGGWQTSTRPWFRGEPSGIKRPLLPKLFRSGFDELSLLQHFRMKSPSLGLGYVPPREYTDQWLFLAQHVGLPTRLLDWTEGLLIALHFALHTREPGAVVWMLNPIGLNRLTNPNTSENAFPLTWFSLLNHPASVMEVRDMTLLQMHTQKSPKELNKVMKTLDDIQHRENTGIQNIRLAWETKGQDNVGTDYPIAVHPTNIHPRMSSQMSRFTIHGRDDRAISEMSLGSGILRSYEIEEDIIGPMKKQLRMMGIANSSLFPELDGLTAELSDVYKFDPEY